MDPYLCDNYPVKLVRVGVNTIKNNVFNPELNTISLAVLYVIMIVSNTKYNFKGKNALSKTFVS